MEERSYCVYKHTSPSGKIYIGITKQNVNSRWKNGFGYQSSPHFWSAIQKYGWESFKHEIIFNNLSVSEACEYERQLISEYKATDREFGYNEKSGGQIGSLLNDSVKEKISRANRLYYAEHPEVVKRIAEKIRGYRHTEEAKRKMSESAKQRHYALSDEWKSKIGKANKERLLTDSDLYESTCERCRLNGKKSAKPVVQLGLNGDYLNSFHNSHEAEKVTGIPNGNISRCCKGQIKTAGGYKWQYANEYNSGRETA